jgi:hypothetical protein
MHLALGGAYLDRNRFQDAQRQLDEASASTRRGGAHRSRFIEAQMTAEPGKALEDFARRATLTPADPCAYLRPPAAGRERRATPARPPCGGSSRHTAAGPSPEDALHPPGLVQGCRTSNTFFPPAGIAPAFRRSSKAAKKGIAGSRDLSIRW